MTPDPDLSDFPTDLADRLAHELRHADDALAMFELTGDDVWLSLHRLHLEDVADLRTELNRVGNG